MSNPVFTQKMTLHLNGGSKFSELHYQILRDGESTSITRVTRTNGRPSYRVVLDKFFCGDDELDMQTDYLEAKNWLKSHSEKKEEPK